MSGTLAALISAVVTIVVALTAFVGGVLHERRRLGRHLRDHEDQI